jgi:hypothetical protein
MTFCQNRGRWATPRGPVVSELMVGTIFMRRIYHLEPGDSLFFDGMIEHGPLRVYHPPVHFLSIISHVKSPAASGTTREP